MKIIIYLFSFIFISSSFGLAQNSKHDTLFVASWNLENLFDTTNDVGKNDGEFTPESKIEWTQERLDKKLHNLARVIRSMNHDNGPDILGVVEVEHQSLLDSLIQRYMRDNYYKVAYKESPDKRGIDNGIIYNSKKLKLLKVVGDTITLPDKYPTRLILNAVFQYNNNDTLILFENHWPARLGGVEKSEPNRIAAAEELHKLVKGYLTKNPDSKIIIMGDFNDQPSNKSIKEVLSSDSIQCKGNQTLIPDKESLLCNLAFNHFNMGMGTYKYRDTWDMLDQIIVSPALIKGNLKYICDSFSIF